MEMKKIVLSITLLAAAQNIHAMGNMMMNGQMMGGPEEMLKSMTPSDAMQKQAASLYQEISTLKVTKDGASVHVPADLVELAQNTFSMGHTATEEEMQKMGTLQLAYTQIDCPWWRNELTQLMGGNKPFMDALAQFDKDQRTYNTAWMTLRQDAQAEGPANANPSKELESLITLDKSLKKQHADLQQMFKNANKDLEKHLEKVEYLVKQHVQWIIAFCMAINPEFKKSLSPDIVAHLSDAVRKVHTPAKVADLQKKQATVKK